MYQRVHKELNLLHNCISQESYLELLSETLDSWQSQCPEFHAYFRKQWLDSPFNKWQIFLTPTGYPHTNSPIESYNNLI